MQSDHPCLTVQIPFVAVALLVDFAACLFSTLISIHVFYQQNFLSFSRRLASSVNALSGVSCSIDKEHAAVHKRDNA